MNALLIIRYKRVMYCHKFFVTNDDGLCILIPQNNQLHVISLVENTHLNTTTTTSKAMSVCLSKEQSFQSTHFCHRLRWACQLLLSLVTHCTTCRLDRNQKCSRPPACAFFRVTHVLCCSYSLVFYASATAAALWLVPPNLPLMVTHWLLRELLVELPVELRAPSLAPLKAPCRYVTVCFSS